MTTTSGDLLSTGDPGLDRLLGGLLPGDNVVWIGDRDDIHDHVENALISTGATTVVQLADHLEIPIGAEVVDARPGKPHADLKLAEREIVRRGTEPGARVVIRDLDTLVRRLGAEEALAFFTRTCPRLFDLGAIDHTGGRLRVLNAESRPAAVGRIFEVAVTDDALELEEVRAASRLAEGLRRLRTARNLTQTELGRLAGVSPSAISQAEAGRRGLSLDTLLTLAQAMNVSIDDLLTYHPDPGYVLARRDRIPARRGVVPLLDDPNAGLRAYLVVLGPGESGEPGSVHKGAELVLVGNGVVQIMLNEETPVLRGGDAVLVTQDAIRGWRNLLPETARLFWIVR